MTRHPSRKPLLIASNRLPVVLRRDADREWRAVPGSGGLVTALAPVLRAHGGCWVGWPGCTADDDAGVTKALAAANRGSGYALKPVLLSVAERRDYYDGCSNEVLWPLFHDLAWQIHVEPSFWRTFVSVNQRYADVLSRQVEDADTLVWVHDYQLVLVGQALRGLGITCRLGFFLHIPFPPLDVYLKLPWRQKIMEAFLGYDLVGFQTNRDRRNFLQCVQELVPGARTCSSGATTTVSWAGRRVRVGAFPIGIDAHGFSTAAAAPKVTEERTRNRKNMPGQTVILGLDRLDYTKGIPRRLRAFRHFLETHPEHRGKVTLVQVVVPSRVDIRKYKELKRDIEHLVSTVNGQFTRPGWVPVHYMFRALERTELLALYRTARVALVTPLIDGMNLVSKEYCACHADRDAVLILSEFAGASEQLRDGAMLVNPYDIEGVAEAIHGAVTMPHAERLDRMRRLRRNVRQYDVGWWVDSFLDAAALSA